MGKSPEDLDADGLQAGPVSPRLLTLIGEMARTVPTLDPTKGTMNVANGVGQVDEGVLSFEKASHERNLSEDVSSQGIESNTSILGKYTTVVSNLSGDVAANQTDLLDESPGDGLNETGSLNSSLDAMIGSASVLKVDDGNTSLNNASMSWNVSEKLFEDDLSAANESGGGVLIYNTSILLNLSGDLGLNETEGLLDEELDDLNETGLNSSFDYVNISAEARAENRSAGEVHEENMSLGNASISWNVSEQLFEDNQRAANESAGGVLINNTTILLNLSGDLGPNETEGLLDEEFDDLNETGLNSSVD